MRRGPIFNAWWVDTTTGTRTRRATQAELRTATRLWWQFKTIRESKPRSTLRAK
jgi:hypothetical protein